MKRQIRRLVLVLILFAVGAAGSSQAEPIVDRSLVSREVATIDSFRREIEAFYKEGTPNDQREIIATNLKERIPSFKRSLESFVKVLKSQKKWNAGFDRAIEMQMTNMKGDPKPKQALLKAIKEGGGARAVLVDGIATVGEFAEEIDEELKSKPAQHGWLLRFDLVPSAHAINRKIQCGIVLIAAIVTGVGGCEGCAFGGALWLMGHCLPT